jgi:thiol-disulfide isomerase/thioredoxin
MVQNKSSVSQKNIFMLLVASGLFFIGAAFVIFFLPKAREQALAAGYSGVPSELDFPAPDLTLTDLSGKTVSLSDYPGRTVLVNNWATWCPPCKAEMPVLEAYYEAHASQDFVIVAIESGEPASQVADFVSQYGLTFPVWLDPGGLALDAFRNWDLPSSYVVDGNGVIRLSWTGPISRAMLEEYLTPLLEK